MVHGASLAELLRATGDAMRRYSWEGVARPQLMAGTIGSDARAPKAADNIACGRPEATLAEVGLARCGWRDGLKKRRFAPVVRKCREILHEGLAEAG